MFDLMQNLENLKMYNYEQFVACKDMYVESLEHRFRLTTTYYF